MPYGIKTTKEGDRKRERARNKKKEIKIEREKERKKRKKNKLLRDFPEYRISSVWCMDVSIYLKIPR